MPSVPPRPAVDSRQAARRRLIRFLARGGHVTREDIGGVIGIRCCGSARNGREFDSAAFEALQQSGCVVKRQAYQLVPAGPMDTFRLQPSGNQHV